MSIFAYQRLSLFADSELYCLKSNSFLADNRFKKAQSGRSMIEMLGVLAIIGVLSVGGIAGYTKAMMQYKINKTVDQVSHIVGNIRTLYFSQKNYSTVNCPIGNTGCTILHKSHAIPDDMWNDGQIENAFGGDLIIESASKKNSNSNDNKAFILRLSGLPEEACMALATYDWGSSSSSGLIAVAADSSTMGDGITTGVYALADPYYCGRTISPAVACPKTLKTDGLTIPMPADKAAKACSGDDNAVYLKFY